MILKKLKKTMLFFLCFTMFFSAACNNSDLTDTGNSSTSDYEFEYNYADVFIFMGQSNMAGRGNYQEAISVDEGAGYEYRPVTGSDESGWFYHLEEPFGKNENNAALSDTGGGGKSGGFVSSFVQSYFEACQTPVIAVSASVGGTSITKWTPGTDYYEESVSRLRSCIDKIEQEGEFVIRNINMVWCQGESDANSVYNGNLDYVAELKKIVNGLKNLGGASIDKCYIVTLSEYSDGKFVQKKHELAQKQIELCETDGNFELASIKFRNVPDILRDDPHFRQGVYNVVGVDAGKRTAELIYGMPTTECREFIEGEEITVADKYGAKLIYHSSGSYCYFDSSAMNDGDGTLNSPYNDISVISDLEIEAGTKILLRRGSVFKGCLLLDGLNGTEDNPIIVSSYGSGEMPKIDGNDLTETGVVRINNCNHIVVDGLEIYDSANGEGDRRGVYITAESPLTDPETGELIQDKKVEVYKDITVKNCYIHDIRGITDSINYGMSSASKATGGFRIHSLNAFSSFDGIKITQNVIENVDNAGITISGYGYPSPYDEDFSNRAFYNVEISYNEIFNIGKNAIFARNLYGGVIEHNVVHDTCMRCYSGNQIVTSRVWGTVVQYNEGYNNTARENTVDEGAALKLQDGCMLDADLLSRDTIWQYNYSHDNSFGLFLNCTGANSSDVNSKDKVTVRFNVSVFDHGGKGVLYVNYYAKNLDIYNNTFIVSDNCNVVFATNGNNKTYNIFNNLVYDCSENSEMTFKIKLTNQSFFANNIIFSQSGKMMNGLSALFENDSSNKGTDPLLINTDYGTSVADRTGYEKAMLFAKTSALSPCLESGNAQLLSESVKDICGNNYRPAVGAYCGGNN